MYSVNLNEENKKRKREMGDFAAGNEHDSLLGAKTPFRQGIDEGNPMEQTFSGGYGKDAVFDNTLYASSFMDKENSKQIPDYLPGDVRDVTKFSGAADSPFTFTRSTANEKPKSYMSSKNLMESGRNKGGLWDYTYSRFFPEQTPERAAALYSVSSKALDDVATDYFKDDLSSVYDRKLDAARTRANKAFADYSGDPVAAMRIAREEADPAKAADETLAQMDMQKLRQMVEPLARRVGFDVDMYIEDYVKPTLREKMVDDYIEKDKPKNSAEYLLRASYKNSLIGKMNDIGFGNKPFAKIENESLARYDANGWEKFAAGVGSLLIDAPVFASIGSLAGNLVGKATAYATNKLAGRVFAYKATEGMTMQRATAIAERAIANSLKNRILQSASTQGVVLGTYDIANSIADDVLYNNSIDIGKALGSFAKGVATGATVGTAATWLNRVARGLTGGCKMAASAGVLSAESAIFTLSTELDKLANDVEIEPIDILHDFGEGLATLGIMKMTNWRPKGAANKLKSDGTLKDELKLSESEKTEMREMNIEPDEFMSQVESVLKMPSYGIGSTREGITQKYLQMMQSKELTAATKAKLMYVVENKLTSTPPVAFDYNVEKTVKGKWVFTTYDFEGNKIERRLFDDPAKLKSYMLVEKSKLRDNRIAAYERELLQGVDSQNLLRQAGLYAKEKSVSVDDISQALYKRAQNIPLSGWEEMMVRDIVERTAYNQSGMVQYLADVRREIERKHGLEDGSLLVDIKAPFYTRSNAANSALDEYEALVRNEVDALKGGTDSRRAADFRQLGERSIYKGMTNDEVKAKEVKDYYIAHPKDANALGKGPQVKPLKINDDKESPYVWSYNGVKNTVEDLDFFERKAREFADKLGYEVEVVRNEREIPLPNEADEVDVNNYNSKLRAMGWLGNDGKVTINLPNISSVEDVERTVVHECVAHSGLLKLFGNHFRSFLEEVYLKSSGDVRMGIENTKGRYPLVDNYTLIEEYLAHLTEKSALSSGERTMLTSFKDFLKNSLVRLNIYTGRNRRLTESDLMSLLRQHAKYIEQRKAPSDYRRWVFGRFDAAKQKEETYNDRKAYEQSVREKIAAGHYFTKTPAGLYNDKLFHNYEMLSDELKKKALQRWNVTEERVMELKSKDKFRQVENKENDSSNKGNSFDYGDIDYSRAAEIEKRGDGTLGELLHNPSLYAAYPELSDLPVKVVEGSHIPLSYDNIGKQLLLDRNFFANPDKSHYLSAAVQDVVRDYEGFNKAVSRNLFGLNSRLGRKYGEAKKVIESMENARRADPDFDKNREIDKVFEQEYGFLPSEFAKRFPSLDDYTIYKLTGTSVPFNDDAEVRKAVRGSGDDVPRPKGWAAMMKLDDLKKYFTGPLDIIYYKMQQIHNDSPLQFDEINRRVRNATLSPNERGRFEREMEEYAKDALMRMKYPEKLRDDYGYGEYKMKEDEKKRRRRDELEFQKWRDRFSHLEDELDVLN